MCNNNEKRIDLIQRLILNQHLVRAAIVASAASTILVVIWVVINRVEPDALGVMLVLSGLVVGGAVKISGQGILTRFRVVAIFFTMIIPFVASGLSNYINVSSVTPSIVVVGAYVFGVVISASLACRALTSDERVALYRINFRRDISIKFRGSLLVMFVLIVVLFVLEILAASSIEKTFDILQVKEKLKREAVKESTFDPRDNGYRIGERWGEIYSRDECRSAVEGRLSSCEDNTYCLRENPYVLEACLEQAKNVDDN